MNYLLRQCRILCLGLFLCPSGSFSQPSAAAVHAQDSSQLLEALMSRRPENFSQILAFRDSLRVQIIYTQIDRDIHNQPSFRDFYFNVNPARYFYPASTVKMPVALLALQRLHELKLPGLDTDATLITGAAYPGQDPVYNDPTTPDGRPTVAQYVRKIFLVSDNDAFNRLYEFLGQAYINERLHQMGFSDLAILHRLERSLSEDQNRHTNPVEFYDPHGKLLYRQPLQFNDKPFAVHSDSIGRGYMQADSLVRRPMDFSTKNRISLPDLHRILRTLLFPGSVPEKQRFQLSDADYRMVWQAMSAFPSESHFPSYDTANFWDAYGKFLYWGSEKGALPKSIRIFNKEGDAYGFLTDVSYFVDFDQHIEFFLSATIYCNSDQILNDDHYDYENLGLPFLKQLGRMIYDFEKTRLRTREPNVSGFKFNYGN